MTDAPLTVRALHTYPVKSCAGVSVPAARVTARGLEHDRDFMLIDSDGVFMSQRRLPQMALITPTIGATAITLRAPGMEPIDVPLHGPRGGAGSVVVGATVHGHPVSGRHVDPELDDWFATFLPAYRGRRGYRLLRVDEAAPRQVADAHRREVTTNQLGFADGHAILLAAAPSLSALNSGLAEPVAMDRFRPNIVVDGPGLPAYDEDHWGELRIGALRAFVVKACDRCSIPDVDQQTAETGTAVRRALVARRGADADDPSCTGVFFGQNLTHVDGPDVVVRVGDPVRVLTRSPTPNVVLRQAVLASGAR